MTEASSQSGGFLKWLAILLAAGAGAYLLKTTISNPGLPLPDATKAQVIGKADDSWEFFTPDGEKKSLKDLRGKVVFLNIWATWCGPCVQEMPSIAALRQSLEGQEIEFVLVSNEKPEQVKRFMKNKDLNLPFYISINGVPPVFKTPGIPATFIIDKQGDIIHATVGSEDWDQPGIRKFLMDATKRG